MLKRTPLGELLLADKIITQEQLDTALDKQEKTDRKLPEVLMDLGYVKEEVLLNTIAKQLHVPFLKLSQFQLKPELIRTLPEALARQFKAIPLEKLQDSYLVAMVDPSDLVAHDEISRRLQSPIRVALVREVELMSVMDQLYRRTDEISNLASQLASDMEVDAADEIDTAEPSKTEDAEESAPVIKLLESIFEDADQVGASDIHIEPGRDSLRIRMRIDGLLHETIMDKKSIAPALVLRVKLMSRLNISEKRLPQDGRFSMKIRGKTIDVRVSTMPTNYGESVVMRLLDQSHGLLKVSNLGLSAKNMQKLLFHISRPHGMILVTGPTGSGKSTTLYACLNELNTPERKIITVEDPIEFTIPRINQVQVQSKIGLDFSLVLRSCLRQDPDIIMVGEIRDEETAAIALRAALTGHLVFSTLHTNDAIAAPTRLVNMGVEPYLVAGTVRLVIAQRLIRRICNDCKREYTPEAQERDWLNIIHKSDTSAFKFFKGRGCAHCGKTGYHGRMAVHEFLELSENMSDALKRGDTEAFSKIARTNPDYVNLVQAAFNEAVAGTSTVDEVLRMATELSLESKGNV
jgi:MSHA biogenesis protein MshE